MVKDLTSNLDLYFTILSLTKDNKNIQKELNISKQKLYYYRQKLQELGFLKKDKNLWVVLKSTKIDLEHALNWKDKRIRGHAFIWKIKIDRIYNWKLILEKKNIKYNLVRGYIPRIFINNKKIWLGKESITVYETKSFYGTNAVESRKYAVFELIKTINELQTKLGITFKYYFKPCREHFGMIKNELARQCNEKGEKIIVRDTLDGDWLWIDDSEGMLGELETGGKGFTKDRAKTNIEVQNWWNDMKKTDFKITPTFLMENTSKLKEEIVLLKNELLINKRDSLKQDKELSESSMDLRLVIKQMEANIRGLTELVYLQQHEISNLKEK